MAIVGQTITNKLTGDVLTWLQTVSSTNGKLVQFELRVQPKGKMPVRHLHLRQSENFRVVKGEFKVESGGQIHILKPGEDFTVQPGTPHQWFNESSTEPAEVIITMQPAEKFEILMEQIYGISNHRGSFNFLQVMVMAKEYDMVIAGPPLFLQRIMRSVLSPIGRLLGYKKYYSEYSSSN